MTKNLLKKPAKGGNPAVDKKRIIVISNTKKLAFEISLTYLKVGKNKEDTLNAINNVNMLSK